MFAKPRTTNKTNKTYTDNNVSTKRNENETNQLNKTSMKLPPVRQTLTSKLRMEIGHPLQFYQSQLKIMNDKANKKTSVQPENRNIKLNNCLKDLKSKVNNENVSVKQNKKKNNLLNGNKSLNLTKTVMPIKTTIESGKTEQITKKTFMKQSEKSVTNTNKLISIKNNIKTIPRKSLTSIHFRRSSEDRNSLISRTNSLTHIKMTEKFIGITPINEVDESRLFKTPSLQRRSIAMHTPASVTSKDCFSPFTQNALPSSSDLTKRLNNWLIKHGKFLGTYHHLKCFNIQQTKPILEENPKYDNENKENIDETKDDSYIELKIPVPQNNYDLSSIAKDALYDLHKLILDGYSRDQCEAWLIIIKNNFPNIEDNYLYWECKAALEEMREDFTSAVDCYKEALVRGAEVGGINNSLENLLQKFSLLQLSPALESKTDDDEKKKKKAKMILDARNVFKSSIINFAISTRSQTKSITENTRTTNYIATPVRRSTRLSRKSYTSTPGVVLCASLNHLESPIQKSIHFQRNKAFQ